MFKLRIIAELNKLVFMRSVFVAIVLLSLFSCQKKDESIVIDLNRNDKVSIFDLADSISVIKLETRSECFIKEIYQIISYKNKFYIFDERLSTVFCFDNQGRYIFKLNKKGRGPDEYVNCQFINIDKYNDQIMILVPWGFILYYDLNGKFISKVELPKEIIAYNEVYAINNNILLFLSINEYRAAYYSRSENKLLKRFLKVSQEQVYVMHPVYKTYDYNDSIFFNDNSLISKVINLSDTTNPVKYSWDFGENNNTIEQINEYYIYKENQKKYRKRVEMEEIYANKKFPNYYPFYSIESKKYRGISLDYGGSEKFVFYDKENNKNIVFDETIEGVRPLKFLRYGRSVVQSISDKNTPILEKILTDNQKRIIESHNPDTDNPFLVIYHIK